MHEQITAKSVARAGDCRIDLFRHQAAPLVWLRMAFVMLMFGGAQLCLWPAVGQQHAADPPLAPAAWVENLMRLTPEQRAELQAVEVPLSVELQYGKRTFQEFQQQLKNQRIECSQQGSDARYLIKLVARMHTRMTHRGRYRNLHVFFADSPEIDARSFAGGYFVFTRGLLDFVGSEAALIGIVGHELSHLDRRHQLKPLQQLMRSQKFFADQKHRPGIWDLDELFGFGQTWMNSLHPFHPDEEAEADQDAVHWMYQLGYDPRELARLFDRLAAQQETDGKFLWPILRTHPPFPDRANRCLEHYQRRQQEDPQRNLVVGRDALSSRSPAKTR